MYKKEACVLHQARAHQGWEEDLHHQTGRCLRWDMFPISVGVRGAFELPSSRHQIRISLTRRV